MSKTVEKAVVSYVLETPLLGKEAGEVVQLDEEAAQALVEAGILREATEDDLAGGEEVEEVEAPELVENAAKDIVTKAEKAVEQATKRLAEKMVRTPAPSVPRVAAQVKERDDTWGFKSLGDYAKCLILREHGNFDAARRMDQVRKKYVNGLVTKGQMETGGGPTVTATDGGNLIPPAYSATLFQKMGAVTNLHDQLQDEPFTGNTLEVPIVNETGATNGVIAYWTTEANAITDSTLPTDMVTLKLNNLCALVNVTDQLLDDNAYSLDNFLNQHVPMKMVYKLNGDVLYGTGGGANVIGAASTIAVSRNTSSRILFADIIAMYSRMAEWCLPNAKWYISPSVLPELFKLSFPDASGSFPLFVPTGQAGGYPSVQYQSPGFLYGKEVVLCSNMQALGNKGDILFADLSQTSKIQKGLDSKMTPFLYFDKAISTLRFILRVDSACRWATTWTRPDGVTESPQIVLTGNSVVPN